MNTTTIALLVVLSATALQAADPAPRELKKLSDHVWAYENTTPMSPANSYGANAGVIAGSKAALVVDTLVSAKEARRLLADIRAITKLPILWTVNTHYHLDHSLGNCVLADQGATIIGAGNAPKLLTERATRDLANIKQYGLTKEEMEGTRPAPATLSFTGTMQIDLGDVIVELRSMPHGHSPDNLIVWIPSDRVMFTGDLMFVDCYPFIGEGDIQNWLKDLDILRTFGAKTLIPGHGRLANDKDIDNMKAYIIAFDKNAKELSKGKSQDDAPQIAEEMKKRLPAQNRKDLENMIEYSLRTKYLPQPDANKNTESTQ